jgi:hypothetical protein
MDLSPRSPNGWSDYMLDALCIGMMLIAVSGMVYVLIR